MKTSQTTNPFRDYPHYDIPTPLTAEALEQVLKDEPAVLSRWQWLEGPNYESILSHPTIFDILVGCAKSCIADRERRIMTELRAALPQVYQNSLPTTLQGFTPDQPGYWFEPERAPLHKDSPRVLLTESIQEHDWHYGVMAPRFLPGITIEMEEVFSVEDLTPGEVVLAGGQFGRLRRIVDTSAAHQGRLSGHRLEFEHDADGRPADCPEDYFSSCVGAHFNSADFPTFRAFRFLRYTPTAFTSLVAPTAPFVGTDFAKLFERYAQREQERLARNAKRRAAYARRKQPQPQLVETPVILWPTRKGTTQHRATA